jgi:hypothetical protein
MKEARIYVDFNEMLEDNLVLLSKTDIEKDSEGNDIQLYEGLKVKIYEDNFDDSNVEDNLIAEGVVELNTSDYSWAKAAKWNCRINEDGIHVESKAK